MQNPIPGTLVKVNNRILDPEEEILIWDIDLPTASIIIQRKDRFIEVYNLRDVRIKSDLILSRIAQGVGIAR